MSGFASAQPTEPPVDESEVAKNEARELFLRGVKQLEAQAYPDAVDSFQRSLALVPRPGTYCNIALAYDKWGQHLDESIANYETCAAQDSSGRFRQRAIERAGELREARAQKRLREEQERKQLTIKPAEVLPTQATAPVQQGAPLAIGIKEPPPKRKGMLIASIVGFALSGASLAVALWSRHEAIMIIDHLNGRYANGALTIPTGSADATLLVEGQGHIRRTVAFYWVSGLMGALSVGLLIGHFVRKPPVTVNIGTNGFQLNARWNF